jgi:hypothetical protein
MVRKGKRKKWVSLLLLIGLPGVLGLILYFDQSSIPYLKSLEELFSFVNQEQIQHEHELVPVKDKEGKIKYWTCTMHPSVRMADPGKCPI